MRTLYALLLTAMSLDEARKVLDFPPGYTPTPEELNKVWRQKAFQFHPDRGGDPAKMVELNVAKDLLSGKGRPTYDRGTGWTPPPRPPEPERRDVNGLDLADALQKAHVPVDTEWLFASTNGWGRGVGDYEGVTASYWVLFGKGPSHPLFVGLWHFVNTKLYDRVIHDCWGAFRNDVPASYDMSKKALQAVKETITLSESGSKGTLTGIKQPNKFELWPGGRITEATLGKIQHRTGVALKDILVGAGLVSQADSTRKIQVELKGDLNKARSKEFYGLPLRQRMRVESIYDWSVLLNGKEYALDPGTVANAHLLFFSLLDPDMIGAQTLRKNLTRARGGMMKLDAQGAIRLLLDALTTESSELVLGLSRALEEAEGVYGKTSYTYFRG